MGEILYGKGNKSHALGRLRGLRIRCEAVKPGTVSGSGSGYVADDLTALSAVTKSIRDGMGRLIENTEAFLSGYGESMETVDESAALMIEEGDGG